MGKNPRIPVHLVHDLWNLDGMRLGTLGANGSEGDGAANWLGDVVLVVGAVEVFTVPAAMLVVYR